MIVPFIWDYLPYKCIAPTRHQVGLTWINMAPYPSELIRGNKRVHTN